MHALMVHYVLGHFHSHAIYYFPPQRQLQLTWALSTQTTSEYTKTRREKLSNTTVYLFGLIRVRQEQLETHHVPV